MKWNSVVSFYLVNFFSVCLAQTCDKQRNLSGVISTSFADNRHYVKCWEISVPRGSYVRLDFDELYFKDGKCSYAYVKINTTAKDEQIICSKETNQMSMTFLHTLSITYFHSYNGNSLLKLHYTTESLICIEDNFFRCSEYQCIHEDQVCDGVKDCDDGSDEAHCETGVGLIKGVNISREHAINWLKSHQSDSSGWGKNTHRAIVALFLAGGARFKGDLEDNLMAKQLDSQATVSLLRNSTEPISINELSIYINALSITCHNPRHFYGIDLLKILSERVLTLRSPSPIAFLTLCNANWNISEPQIRSLLTILYKQPRYAFHMDIQALSVMALTCIKNKIVTFYNIENSTKLYNATVENFISRQQHDGSFGNVYTTAVITQALLSSGQENNKDWNLKSTVKYLMAKLNSSSIDFLSAYFVAPIFNGKSLVDLENIDCGKMNKKDEEISDVIHKLGRKIQIKYYLYIGDQKDVIHSIYLKMPENSSAYDVMKVAQAEDPKYKFYKTVVSNHVYIYEIAGITNDPELGKFWLLYTRDVTLEHRIESPDRIFLHDGDHLIMWYKTGHV